MASSGSVALGKGGKAAQVAEHHGHFAAVAVEQRVVSVGRRDQLRDLRRQEALQPADAFDFAELLFDPLFQRLVPVQELVGLFLQLAGLLLNG